MQIIILSRAAVLAEEQSQKWIEGKTLKKVIINTEEKL